MPGRKKERASLTLGRPLPPPPLRLPSPQRRPSSWASTHSHRWQCLGRLDRVAHLQEPTEHSYSMIRVCSRVRERCARACLFTLLYEKQTPRGGAGRA